MGYIDLEEIGKNEVGDYVISTIKPGCSNVYETAICLKELGNWHVIETYTTKEFAMEGHRKYSNMKSKDLENLTR